MSAIEDKTARKPVSETERRLEVAVVQDGARLHYGVPAALHRAGALKLMFSEWFLKETFFWRAVGGILGAFGGANLRAAMERSCAEIPSSMVRINPALVLRQRRERKRFASGEAYYKWSSEVAGKWIESSDVWQANVLFGFIRNVDAGLCRACRQRGILTVGDQMIAPAAVEREEFDKQSQRWPGWEPSKGRPDFEPVEGVEKETWEALDRITCASEYVRGGLLRQGVSENKISVIPYPIDAGEYHFSPREGRSGPLVVGFVGAVGLRKGSPYFLQVARRLAGAKLKFVMVGPVLLSEAGVKEMSPHVELAGRVARSEVANFMRRFDIFLFPSTCEGSAGAAMEAMAFGLPVVASPNAGTCVRDGVEGYVRNYDDIDGLAGCVQRLAEDAGLRVNMGREARKWAEAINLDWYGSRLVEVMRGDLNS